MSPYQYEKWQHWCKNSSYGEYYIKKYGVQPPFLLFEYFRDFISPDNVTGRIIWESNRNHARSFPDWVFPLDIVELVDRVEWLAVGNRRFEALDQMRNVARVKRKLLDLHKAYLVAQRDVRALWKVGRIIRNSQSSVALSPPQLKSQRNVKHFAKKTVVNPRRKMWIITWLSDQYYFNRPDSDFIGKLGSALSKIADDFVFKLEKGTRESVQVYFMHVKFKKQMHGSRVCSFLDDELSKIVGSDKHLCWLPLNPTHNCNMHKSRQKLPDFLPSEHVIAGPWRKRDLNAAPR